MARIDHAIALADPPWRDPLHLCRPDAGARPASAGACSRPRRPGPISAWSIPPRTPCASPAPTRSARWSSSPSASRPPPRPPPWRLKQRPGRGAREFLDLLQPRPDPAGPAHHPGDRGSGRRRNSTASWGPPMSAPSSAAEPYDFVPREFGKPVVIAGFEPLDVMQSDPDADPPAQRRAAARSRTSTPAP